MFCQNCGSQMKDTDLFCQSCGAPLKPSQETNNAAHQTPPIITPPPIPRPQATPPNTINQPSMPGVAPSQLNQQGFSQQPTNQQGYQQQPTNQQSYSQQPTNPQAFSQQPYNNANNNAGMNQNYNSFTATPVPKKKNILAIGIASILIIGIVLVGAYMIFKPSGVLKSTKSSLVSKGVNTDDLGNIMNGQYFFDDGSNQYYSSFDSNTAAHIYKIAKGSSKGTSLFDGFGWSLVINQNWLYFSGNQGKTIDGTYNLFRIRTDGTGLEKLNIGYCYGMSIYNNNLYYVKKPDVKSEEYDIYSSGLDGKNEKQILKGPIYFFVIYDSKLYYLNSLGALYTAKADGTASVKISTEPITRFIIGNGKIVYEAKTGDIKHMDVKGKNIKLVRAAGAKPIATLNSYKGNIFYAEYDKDAVAGTYANNYYLHSIKFDGTADKLIYTGLSYGTYVNLLNDKTFVLDYALNPSTSKMPAIAKDMDLDGKNLKELFR